MDQVSVQDPSDGRSQGMKQFLDDKSFKPGLGAYKKS
jgi:trans-feruloyl-CoA hydratase/vanillin synthase